MDYFAGRCILHNVAGKICFFLAALFLFSSVPAFPEPSDSTVAGILPSNSSDSLLNKVIICRGDHQFVPFEFINDEGEPDGFTVEVFRKLMKNLGLRYELALDDWTVVQDQLAAKEIDVAIGMIYSPERSRNCLFGMPYCTLSFNIISRNGSGFNTLDGLKGKRIIVQNKDRAHEYLLETNLTDSIIPVSSILAGMDLLSSGRGDALLSYDLTSYYFQNQKKYSNLQFSEAKIEPLVYAFVVNVDDSKLLSTLNEGLAQMRLDGSYDVIYEKWFSHYNKYMFLEKIKPYLWGLGSLAVVAFFFIWLLNYRVTVATRDLKNENNRRKELEADLVAAKEKAERAEQLEMVFLASMSHELRTPINAIVGFSQLLQNPDATQEDRQNYMEIINANNEHVLRLISDILDLSKIESGTVEIRLSNFDAVQVFEEECAIFTPRFEALGIQFIKDNPLSEFIIRCDRGRLIQVMSNFLSNALKYTSEGSVTFGLRKEDGGLKVSVKDTGRGIAPENVQSVFEKFEKLDPSVQGTGLGLSICKAITDTFNGRIGVESNLGEGSTFWAWFPSDYRNK